MREWAHRAIQTAEEKLIMVRRQKKMGSKNNLKITIVEQVSYVVAIKTTIANLEYTTLFICFSLAP